MDTWATSSLSPADRRRAGIDDPDLFARVFPMDLRPQAHDIIRTWLFYTVVRVALEHGALPWADAAISGFVIDPDRKKLSKSAGNSPDDPIGADRASTAPTRVRYWAGGGRPGTDVDFDRERVQGRAAGSPSSCSTRRSSRSASRRGGRRRAPITEPLDRALLRSLAAAGRRRHDRLRRATTTPGRSSATETFFWSFCDDYLELVKSRAYGEAGRRAEARRRTPHAAHRARRRCCGCSRRSSPFVTEEVWSWWHEGSVHRAPWPNAADLAAYHAGDLNVLLAAARVLGAVRRTKTEAKVGMKAKVHASCCAPAKKT